MLKITLSLWDTGGQNRFNFFKTEFFRGVAAVGLVFDLSRPDTFDKIDKYFDEIRERSGNIPIFLVGNKTDLKENIGETIPREKIIQKVNQYYLFEYIETSAMEYENVEKLFYRLAITSMLDFKPRLGEIVDVNHLRFKILLTGAAAVGKSSLIRTFTQKQFNQDYKLTVACDFMVQDMEISEEEIPIEILEQIKKSVRIFKKKIRKSRKKEEISETPSVATEEIDDQILEGKIFSQNKNRSGKSLKKYIIMGLALIGIVMIIFISLNYFL